MAFQSPAQRPPCLGQQMARREYKNRGPCVSIIANISILRLREELERPYCMINRLVLLLFSAAWQDGGAGKKLVTEPRPGGLTS